MNQKTWNTLANQATRLMHQMQPWCIRNTPNSHASNFDPDFFHVWTIDNIFEEFEHAIGNDIWSLTN